MTTTNPLGATRVTVGVDTHRDERMAVAVDWLGARLSQHWVAGCFQGLRRASPLGVWAGGGRCLRYRRYGLRTIIEVNRPDRSTPIRDRVL